MDRNSVIDYVERLRAKPEHIRRRIAVGTTVGVTGVVAAGWLTALVLSGSLALAPVGASSSTLASAPGTTQVVNAATQTQSSFTQLLGAVGLANASSAPASLNVVDASTTTPSTDGSEDDSPTGGNQTVIPF
jgi:hypothetical protein